MRHKHLRFLFIELHRLAIRDQGNVGNVDFFFSKRPHKLPPSSYSAIAVRALTLSWCMFLGLPLGGETADEASIYIFVHSRPRTFLLRTFTKSGTRS